METRNAKLIVNKSGGTASEKSKTYRVTIPNSWVEQLGISEDNREIELSFDGSEITVRRKQTMQEYKDTHNRNKLLQLQFYHGDSLCTTILVGVNDDPGWQDYQSFLEERCIPKSRAGLKEYLNAIGVDEYNPVEIIRKTKGKMAEDQSWLEVTEL